MSVNDNPASENDPQGPSPELAHQPLNPQSGFLGQLNDDSFDLLQAAGGIQGLLESIVPGLTFVVVFVATQSLPPALIYSTLLAVIAFAVRLIRRQSWHMAASGIVGVLIGVIWAWRSGEASNYFVFGLWTNAAYLALTLVSVLARYPLIGFLVSLVTAEQDWRTGPHYRRYRTATMLWAGLFAVRLLIQVPLYFSGATALLGTARLVMGVPLFAVTAWLTWLLVRETGSREAPEGVLPPEHPQQ